MTTRSFSATVVQHTWFYVPSAGDGSWQDLNLEPFDCQASALPLSYIPAPNFNWNMQIIELPYNARNMTFITRVKRNLKCIELPFEIDPAVTFLSIYHNAFMLSHFRWRAAAYVDSIWPSDIGLDSQQTWYALSLSVLFFWFLYKCAVWILMPP